MVSVLVTGAPGWLGTRLVEILREKGREVACVVLPQLDTTALESQGARIIKADLTTGVGLAGACKNSTTVFHCAGIIHPCFIKELYAVNVTGTKNILGEAIASGVKKFVYISSNSVGGTNTKRNVLMTEEDPPRPYKHYGCSKHAAEILINQAYHEGKIATTIVRPCWFYGIRQPDRQTQFFRMIKKGNPLIFGDGNNLRSMSYIDNIIEALLLIEEKDIAIGKTYWIADKKPYSTIDIYRTIARLLEVKDLRPRFLPGFISPFFEFADTLLQMLGLYQKEIHVAGEMDKDIVCSIEKAQRELGYDPKVDLEEGMRRSIEWCRANNIQI